METIWRKCRRYPSHEISNEYHVRNILSKVLEPVVECNDDTKGIVMLPHGQVLRRIKVNVLYEAVFSETLNDDWINTLYREYPTLIKPAIIKALKPSVRNRLLIRKMQWLIKEFDIDHPGNKGIDINTLSYGSGIHIWWKCSLDHSWYAPISNRTKDATLSKCPGCNVIKMRTNISLEEEKERLERYDSREAADTVAIGDIKELLVKEMFDQMELENTRFGHIGGCKLDFIVKFEEKYRGIQVKSLSVVDKDDDKWIFSRW